MTSATFKISISVKNDGEPMRFELLNGKGEDAEINSFEDLLKYTKQALITISKEVLAEEQQKGFDRKPVRMVDGSFSKTEDNVNPLGKIEYAARQDLKEIALYIYDNIEILSKSSSGTYKRYNVMYWGDSLVATNRSEIISFFESHKGVQGTKIRFVNLTPYARKLERFGKFKGNKGKKKYRKSRDDLLRSGSVRKSGLGQSVMVLAESGTYFQAAQRARSAFKGNSLIKFEILPGGYLGLDKLDIKNPRGEGMLRKVYAGTNDPYMYPTILLYVQ